MYAGRLYDVILGSLGEVIGVYTHNYIYIYQKPANGEFVPSSIGT